MNTFFVEAVEKLDIQPYLSDDEVSKLTNESDNIIGNIVKSYRTHPSVIKIKENVVEDSKFSFKNKTTFDMEREILKLDVRKATPPDDLPVKLLLKTHDIIAPHLCSFYNKAKKDLKYPNALKKANVIPIHKKDEKTLTKSSFVFVKLRTFSMVMFKMFKAHQRKWLNFLFQLRNF